MAAAAPEALDLNTASVAELEALPGVGRGRAELIVRVRTRNGPFRSIRELRALPRITLKTIDKLQPFLIVNPGGPEEERTPDPRKRSPTAIR